MVRIPCPICGTYLGGRSGAGVPDPIVCPCTLPSAKHNQCATCRTFFMSDRQRDHHVLNAARLCKPSARTGGAKD